MSRTATVTDAPRRARHELLDADEERTLSARWKAGEAAARDRLVECNLGLVKHWAVRYQNRGLDFEDLEQWGRFGLIEACDEFDPERGFRFSTVATLHIKKRIRRGLADEGSLIRLPVHIHAARYRIGMDIPVDGIASPGCLAAAEIAARAGRSQPVDAKGRQFIIDGLAVRGDDEDDSDPRIDPEVIPSLLSVLTEKQAKIMRLRFGLDDREPLTLDQVGERFGVTRERIRQIEVKALARMRREIEGRASGARKSPPVAPDERPERMSTTQPRIATRPPDPPPPFPGVAEIRRRKRPPSVVRPDVPKSHYFGVNWSSRCRKWQAQVKVGRTNRFAGYHAEESDAARAYDRKAVQAFGRTAELNFPEEWADVLAMARPDFVPEARAKGNRQVGEATRSPTTAIITPPDRPPVDPAVLSACWADHPAWTVQDIAHEYEARTGNRIRSSEAWAGKPITDPAPIVEAPPEMNPLPVPAASPMVPTIPPPTIPMRSATQEEPRRPIVTMDRPPVADPIVALTPDRSPDDPEVAAMALVVRALAMLDGPGRGRVLGYAVARFGEG